jgi:hypothetical protein
MATHPPAALWVTGEHTPAAGPRPSGTALLASLVVAGRLPPAPRRRLQPASRVRSTLSRNWAGWGEPVKLNKQTIVGIR